MTNEAMEAGREFQLRSPTVFHGDPRPDGKTPGERRARPDQPMPPRSRLQSGGGMGVGL